MGLKGLMTAMGMNVYGLVAMVLFLVAFVAVLVRTWTRPQSEIDAQSRLWMDDEDRETTT